MLSTRPPLTLGTIVIFGHPSSCRVAVGGTKADVTVVWRKPLPDIRNVESGGISDRQKQYISWGWVVGDSTTGGGRGVRRRRTHRGPKSVAQSDVPKVYRGLNRRHRYTPLKYLPGRYDQADHRNLGWFHRGVQGRTRNRKCLSRRCRLVLLLLAHAIRSETGWWHDQQNITDV